MCEPTWRSIGVVLVPLVDMRFVMKARANENAPPPAPRRLAPPDFLVLVDASQEEEPPPAA
jgi:hypothetical protein